MDESNELKPCPFCGGKADSLMPTLTKDDLDTKPSEVPGRFYSLIRCRSCGVKIPGGDFDNDGRLAAAAWNRRATGWRPIETAPKDATAVLVMRDIWPGTKSGRAEECNGHNTYVAEWWGDERGANGSWVCYMGAVLDPECPIDPTHWMPLPEPPNE